jgi:hypothetical protein
MSEDRPQNFLNDTAKSAQERYYEFMLRKDKLSSIATAGVSAGWLDESEKKALGDISEKEKLETKILARLYSLSDSSPEYLQVRALTDCKDREACARSLADIYYRKYTTEEVLNRFVAPEITRSKILQPALNSSRTRYDAFGNN